ncbi:hydrogenase maturation nickel metallochaperone HypA [candidate division KSB1 bacterium]|nr:hydrogenase maturation nickel metallochaperone HypA [candidate division KSB1 bacterium]
MHELSLIANIIDIVREEMPRHNLKKIQRITLRIGEMRQVVPEALHFGFECLSKDTPLEGAELKIENVPLTGFCNQCNKKSAITDWFQACPVCQTGALEIVSGKELEIAEFEGE